MRVIEGRFDQGHAHALIGGTDICPSFLRISTSTADLIHSSMWEVHLKRASNGHFSNLLSGYRSNSLPVTAPRIFAPLEASRIRACSFPSRSWSRNVWSGILAASLLSGQWTGGSSQAVVLESRQAISDALAQHTTWDQQSSFSRLRVTSGKSVAVPMAQAAAKEAASDTKNPIRSEGYLNAKGHNGQINRIYYSVPKGQVRTLPSHPP